MTLRSCRPRHKAKIINLGLRLTDVRALDLEGSAEAAFDRGGESAKRENLSLNGATAEEIEFLLTRRVELNALPSDRLVAFIEHKLNEHGIQKVMPGADLLGNAYRLFARGRRAEKIVEQTIEKITSEDIAAPTDLGVRVGSHLRQHPGKRWDEAVAGLVDADLIRETKPRK